MYLRLDVCSFRGLLSCLCAAFVVASATCASAQRNPDDVLVGEDDDNYYYMTASAYRNSTAQQIGVRFCRAKLATAADQAAIRQLGFDVSTERFELFGDVARDEKAALERKVFDAFLDQALEGADTVFADAASLNPWNVNDAVDMLRQNGFANEMVIAALRKIARQRDKPALLAAYREFADAAKTAKESWTTSAEIAKDRDSRQARLLLGALKMIQGNAELGLAVTTAEFAESLAYLAYVSPRIDELERTTNDKLATLATLGKRLKQHVDETRSARSAWRRATGYPSARPICNS